ncbi:MAG: (d)CMP kinase [Amylibacter sp.]|jgi:cytidylate kinase|tara:strand:+ start:202 stop:837 length:636 start_codon:yes stop_codon:yes gene_type:complete
MKFTVAIDGPAAAGKGTISKAIAANFKFAHLDTGLLYRGVGKKALAYSRTSFYPEISEQLALELTPEDLLSDDLRTDEVAQAASKVAIIPEVRDVLFDFQRNFANQEGGTVLDGRDIGTIICPNADVKLFITASAEVRALRRFKELTKNGHKVSLQDVLNDVLGRDARDRERTVSPLIAAEDAIIIDTSHLSIELAISTAIEAVTVKFKVK